MKAQTCSTEMLCQRKVGVEQEGDLNTHRAQSCSGFRGSTCAEKVWCGGHPSAEALPGALGAGVWHLSVLESVSTSADI